MKVASVAWKLRHSQTDGAFFGHFHDLISQSHDAGAELVVFPEYNSFELLEIDPSLKEKDIPLFLHQYSDQIEEWLLRISGSSGMTIVGGSYLKLTDDGPRNICPIAFPDGRLLLVEKNRLSRYEKEVLKLGLGKGLKMGTGTQFSAILSHDIEFPESGRALSEAGALAQCVPSKADSNFGFDRVRVCCQARAIENQVFVIHSSLVGSLKSRPHRHAVGTAAVIAPLFEPFPRHGILAETSMNHEGIAVAELQFEVLEEVRSQGNVQNWNDRHPLYWDVMIDGPS